MGKDKNPEPAGAVADHNWCRKCGKLGEFPEQICDSCWFDRHGTIAGDVVITEKKKKR